ncbi:MAG: imidazolonepropionase [Thermoguttaceae bacterium]
MPRSATASCDRVWINARLATMGIGEPSVDGARPIHAVRVCGDKIVAIGPIEAGGDASISEIVDCRGAWITPGLVDCHTHLVYGGNRSREIAMRWSGVPYEEIARQGGGILATVRSTRAASEDALLNDSLPRVRALAAEGVTTVEIKSGYGLRVADELKMLRVARRIAEKVPINVTTTLLAAHALPPEYADRPDDYVTLIRDEMIPAAVAESLADAVDVFCDRIAFSPAQCERIFEAARHHDLPVKGHFEQLSNLGGSQMAARFKPLSVDHLEHLDRAGVQAIAEAGAVAVLLPGAYYFLRETRRPPVDELRAAGVPMAVASDLNPGTCPLASLRLMLGMACTLFGLTPEEAMAGATRHAARALGMADRAGTLAVGRQADFLVWDIDEPSQLASEFGIPRLRQRVFKGQITWQQP